MLNHEDDSMQNFTHKCSIHTVYNAMCSLMQPARTWPSLLNWQKCLVHVKGSVLTIECMQEQSFQCLGVHIALLPLCLLNVVATYHLYFQLLIMNESYQVYCSVISAKSYLCHISTVYARWRNQKSNSRYQMLWHFYWTFIFFFLVCEGSCYEAGIYHSVRKYAVNFTTYKMLLQCWCISVAFAHQVSWHWKLPHPSDCHEPHYSDYGFLLSRAVWPWRLESVTTCTQPAYAQSFPEAVVYPAYSCGTVYKFGVVYVLQLLCDAADFPVEVIYSTTYNLLYSGHVLIATGKPCARQSFFVCWGVCHVAFTP